MKPRVASPTSYPGLVCYAQFIYPAKGCIEVCPMEAYGLTNARCKPFRLDQFIGAIPRVARRTRNPGLDASDPFGMIEMSKLQWPLPRAREAAAERKSLRTLWASVI